MTHETDALFAAEPLALPVSHEDLVAYIQRQLQNIQDSFQLGYAQHVHFLHAPPERLREGFIAGADGTNWNPGAGQGVYCYYAGAWNKLG